MPAPGAKGRVLQGYHGQAAVDAAAQIIVAVEVADEANDQQQAQSLLTQVLVTTGQVPRTVSMDDGCGLFQRSDRRGGGGLSAAYSSRSVAPSPVSAERAPGPAFGRTVGG